MAAQNGVTIADEELLHKGIVVLCNMTLWDIITAFMTGYPYPVYAFYREHKPKASCLKLDRRIGTLMGTGVLPHLAIAFNKPQMIPALYTVYTVPAYENDHKLSFKRTMRYAVLYNNLAAIACLTELIDQDEWEPYLMRFAITLSDPNLRLLEWIFTHLPRKKYPLRGATCSSTRFEATSPSSSGSTRTTQ